MIFLKPENPISLRSTHAADHMIDVLRVVTCDRKM